VGGALAPTYEEARAPMVAQRDMYSRMREQDRRREDTQAQTGLQYQALTSRAQSLIDAMANAGGNPEVMAQLSRELVRVGQEFSAIGPGFAQAREGTYPQVPDAPPSVDPLVQRPVGDPLGGDQDFARGAMD